MQSFSSRAENEHNRSYYPLIPQNCRYPCSIVVLQYSRIINCYFYVRGFISINEQLFSPVISILLSLCVCVCEISHDIVHYVKSCGVMVGMGS